MRGGRVPDEHRGAHALVRAAIAPLHAEPRVSSAQVSQRLAGHEVEIVREEGEWRRVRGADGYEGWMHRGYLAPLPGASPERRLSLGCRVRDTQTLRTRLLPLGAWLASDEQADEGEVVFESRLAARFPLNAQSIVRTASDRFAGASYQWGGVTPWGVDCSGFVQSIFALHGVVMRRDAWQQGEMGDAAPSDPLALSPADLLFFSDRDDRRPTHVGVSLGERRMAHVALGRGGHAIERLDDGHDAYIAALRSFFCFARRIPLTAQ